MLRATFRSLLSSPPTLCWGFNGVCTRQQKIIAGRVAFRWSICADKCSHLAPRDVPCTVHVVLPKPTANFKQRCWSCDEDPPGVSSATNCLQGLVSTERDGYFENSSIVDHVSTNVAILLRKMCLVRYTLCCQSRLLISISAEKVAMRFGPVFPYRRAGCKDSSRRSETATVDISLRRDVSYAAHVLLPIPADNPNRYRWSCVEGQPWVSIATGCPQGFV